MSWCNSCSIFAMSWGAKMCKDVRIGRIAMSPTNFTFFACRSFWKTVGLQLLSFGVMAESKEMTYTMEYPPEKLNFRQHFSSLLRFCKVEHFVYLSFGGRLVWICCCFVGISGCRMQVVEWRCVVDSFGSRKPGRFGGCSMAVTCWEGECEGLLDTERASSILVHKGNLDSWFFLLIESFWLRFWVKSLSWTVLGLSPFRLLKAFWRLLWPVSTTPTWKLSSSAFHNSALNLPENTHWRTKRISAVETCRNLRPSSTMTGRVCRQKVQLDLWAKKKEPPQITSDIIFLCKDNTLSLGLIVLHTP